MNNGKPQDNDNEASNLMTEQECAMTQASYQPWFPVERKLKPHPDLSCRLEGVSLTLLWQELNDCAFSMEIHFPTIAGILVIDESSYQTFSNSIHVNLNDDLGSNINNEKINTPFPIDIDLNMTNPSRSDYFSLPWPIWKSVRNARRPYYGELGENIYQSLYSYYIVGADSVYLIDTETKPEIKILSC